MSNLQSTSNSGVTHATLAFLFRFGMLVVALSLSFGAAAACERPALSAEDEALAEFDSGQQYEAKGNLARARDAYTSAIRLDSSLAEAYAARGHVAYRLNDSVSALGDLNRAIDLEPEMALAYNHRGLLFAANDDFDRAVLDYTRAIQIDPNLGAAYFNRAGLYFVNEDVNSTIADLSSAIALNPRSAVLRLTRGRIYLRSGDTASAIDDLEQVLGLTQDESLTIPAKQMLLGLR